MEDDPSAPLLEATTTTTGQPVVMGQQPQQVIYAQGQQPQQVVYAQGQQPQQQVIYAQQGQQPVQYQYQQQPQPATGYGAGNMYQQPIQPQQQPQYQQQGQPVIMQPAQQNTGPQPALQKPTDQQLGEGFGELPAIVQQPEPIRVSGSKDGIGCAEGCQRNPHIFSWILTIAIWLCICSILICNIAFATDSDGYCGFFAGNIGAALGVTAAIAIIYWIECFCAGTGKYLRHMLQNEGAVQFVERLKREPAVIRWHVACYHYETRRRSKQVTDSNGNTRTEWETYQEKVYTWRASEQYRYSTCIDVSGQLLGLDEYNITKLRIRKTYGFVDTQSQQQYIMQRRTFRMMNWRDIHQEFREEFDIPGFVDRILAESEPGIKPSWMSAGCYWLSNMIFLSPCFRHKMSAACGNADYVFIKQLSAY